MVGVAKQVGGAQQVGEQLAQSILILDLRECSYCVVSWLALMALHPCDPTYRCIRCGRLRFLSAVQPPTGGWGVTQGGVH